MDQLSIIKKINTDYFYYPLLDRRYLSFKNERFFKLLVKKIMKQKKELDINMTLVRLLYNTWYNEDIRIPPTTYISGPSSISYHRVSSLDKDVYIFGDNQQYKEHCTATGSIFIYDYLKKLFKTTTRFIDFYLEFTPIDMNTEYIVPRHKTLEEKERIIKKDYGTLDYLGYKFVSCMQKKRNKFCNNIRAHYSDIRYSEYNPYSKDYISFSIIDALGDYFKENLKVGVNSDAEVIRNFKDIDVNIFLTFYDNITILDPAKKNHFLVSEIQKNRKLLKQMEKIKNHNIQDSIFSFFADYISVNVLDKNIIIGNILPYKYRIEDGTIFDKEETKFDDGILKLCEWLGYIFDILKNINMDFYLICRMFVDYNTDKTHGEKFYAPSKQNNIIIYASSERSKLYRKFFEHLNKTTPTTNSELNNISRQYNCLEINSIAIPQPFFKARY